MQDFFTDQQHEAQAITGSRLERAWHTRVFWFPKYSPIDCYLADGPDEGTRIRALAEFKSDHRAARTSNGKRLYTLFNLDRYQALWFGRLTFGVPALVIVQFTDELRAISIEDISFGLLRMSGPKRVRPGAPQERCPKVPIPVDTMTVVRDSNMDEVLSERPW